MTAPSPAAVVPDVSVESFRKQRAVNIIVAGNYAFPNRYDPQGKPRTFACRTTRVSPFRMMVEVPVMGRIGDRLTSYFPDFGKFDGRITDTKSGSFLLELDMTGSMREKFASKLTWLDKKQKNPAIRDVRKDARIIPASPHSTLTLADGSVHSCFIIDMSISGVAVSVNRSRRSGCRWPSGPASAAWSGFCPMASPSSLSRPRTARISTGCSCARRAPESRSCAG